MDKEIVASASPTLAGIKCGNLFTYTKNDGVESIHKLNLRLNKAGIYVEPLQSEKNRVLVYVYRKDMLARDLFKTDTRTFMRSFGYKDTDPDHCVEHLKERFKYGFPHEIGLFLGYPPEDVKGFIKNKGKNYIFCGYWKVYCDEKKARSRFCKYKNCTNRYCKLYEGGMPLEKLITGGLK